MFQKTRDEKTLPNATLYDMNGGTPGLSVHCCVENWKAGGGCPDEMCVHDVIFLLEAVATSICISLFIFSVLSQFAKPPMVKHCQMTRESAIC